MKLPPRKLPPKPSATPTALAPARGHPASVVLGKPKPPPANLLADILNGKKYDEHRMDMSRTDWRIHVSGLIDVTPSTKFCPRQYAISHFEQRERSPRGMTAGAKILFKLGDALHDLVRDEFINSPYGHTAFGCWHCPCKHVQITNATRPRLDMRCTRCGEWPGIYQEVDLYIGDYHLVGHPDFVIKWHGVYLLYEIKTLDRADVVFDNMTEPLGAHTLQASFYYFMMKKLNYNVSPQVRYLYVDRSTTKIFSGHPYKEFISRHSMADRLSPFLDKAAVVVSSIKSKKLPQRICDAANCTRAKRCSVAVSCFSRTSDAIAA